MYKCSGVFVSKDQKQNFDGPLQNLQRYASRMLQNKKYVILQRNEINGFDSQRILLPSSLLQKFNQM